MQLSPAVKSKETPSNLIPMLTVEEGDEVEVVEVVAVDSEGVRFSIPGLGALMMLDADSSVASSSAPLCSIPPITQRVVKIELDE